jgi:peptide/nickel transport system substrate-binding protein
VKKLLVLFLILVLAFSVVACSPSEEPGKNGQTSGEPVVGGTLRIGVQSEVANVAAWRLRSPQETLIWSAIYEPLFKMGANGEVVPYLAKSIEADPENLTYTVTLREDVYFSDGSHLDADVLLWNFENFKENSQIAGRYFSDVESFEKTGDYTVVIHLSRWNSQMPFSLTENPGLMYSKKAFDEHGYDWCMENPVGTGPYKLENWVFGESKTLVKNENYWNKDATVYFDKIEFPVIPEEMTAQAALLSGDIDAFYGPSNATMAEMLEKGGFHVTSGKLRSRIIFLIFGSDVKGDSPLEDVRVRQAISYAIDSEAIAKNIDKGLTYACRQYAVPDTPFYNPEIEGYGYDPEKAKQLLKEAGYENGFVTTIYVGLDNPFEDYMVAIQGYLKEVGIGVNLVYQDVSLWSTKTMFEIDDGMVLIGHGFGANLVNQMADNFSKRAVDGSGMLKLSKLHPDDLHEEIMAAISATDEETMYKHVHAAGKMIIDKYCLGYPVVMGPFANVLMREDIVDDHWIAHYSDFFDYTGVYRVQ